jgi:hypothetical protein
MNEENEKNFYRGKITDMINGIGNLEWLIKIYSFVKVFYEDRDRRAIK